MEKKPLEPQPRRMVETTKPDQKQQTYRPANPGQQTPPQPTPQPGQQPLPKK